MVVQKFILQLEAQLADRHVTIEASDDALDWLAKNGFDELLWRPASGPGDPGGDQEEAVRPSSTSCSAAWPRAGM